MIPQAKQFFLETLQKALNQYLALDPESSNRLRGLNGKLVALELLPFKVTFYLQFSEAKAQLTMTTTGTPETIIKGTPLRLIMLALVPHQHRKQFFAHDVVMAGNAALGQQVIEVFDQLEIDWEELIAKIFGDVPAYHAGNAVRGAKAWLDKTRAVFLQNLNEYLHEEVNVFPPGEAMQDFFKEVDAVRMDTDRLDARVQRLQNQLAAKRGDL